MVTERIPLRYNCVEVMEIGDDQFSCSPDEYFDGVADKCIPCADVCKQEPLEFCKNNCPEFYKKLATATHRSIADTSRSTFVDNFSLTSTTTDPSPNDISRTLSPTQVIPLTTLFALVAAVIAICIAVVAFILICKARRREKCDARSRDTENPLLRAESDSLCKSNFSTSSSNGGSLNAQNQNSKASLIGDYVNPPDVARDAKAGDDERILENTRTASSSSSGGGTKSRGHAWKTCDGKVCDETSETVDR